jgi:hypothetical protein
MIYLDHPGSPLWGVKLLFRQRKHAFYWPGWRLGAAWVALTN